MADLHFSLYPEQDDFVADPARFTAFIGGIGSGKTHAGAVRATLEALQVGGLGIVVAPTYPMLRDATLRTFLQLAAPVVSDVHRSEMRVMLTTGAEVLFRSADNPDRLRGPNASWAWIDEAALCPRQTWDIVIGRVREGKYGGRAWLTTTPKGRNWVYDLVASGIVSVHRAATDANPFLPREFVQSIRAAYSGPFLRQEFGGEFVALEGIVYDRFSRDRHVMERSPAGYAVAGVDFGYTNPTAVIVAFTSDLSGVHVCDEFYRRHITLDDLVTACKEFRDLYAVQEFLCDPSEPGAIETLRRAGIPARPARARSVLDGIRYIQSLLDADRLTVSPRCANLIAEFEAYSWLDGKDVPIKQNDHALDALRYALSRRHEPRLILLEAGE